MAIPAMKQPTAARYPSLTRSASCRWAGPLKQGRGMISTSSGALMSLPFSFSTRFESTRGTNPEELIAAAHASCFSMAFANELATAGNVPDRIDTETRLILEKEDSSWTVSQIHLTVRGIVPNCDNDRFAELAHRAKDSCVVSRLLRAPITIETELERPRS